MADSIWDWLAPSIATIGGTAIVASANSRAADQGSEAARRGAQLQVEANQRAQSILDQQRQTAAPGTGYLRQVVATPDTLTPAQQQALEDQRIAEANMMHSSSFAGSGRAGAALLKRSDSDFVNQALDTNRQRALTAAGELNTNVTGATSGISNLESGSGKALGDAETRAGLYQANAGLSTANSMGKAIGDIGSLIANQNKQRITGATPSTRLGAMDGSPGAPRPSSYDPGATLNYSGSSSGYNPAYTG